MPVPTDPAKHKYMFSDDMKFVQKAIIYHPTDNRRFLAIKLSDKHAKRPNEWDLPGGNVLFGVDPVQSLLEEIQEETGLEVSDLKPVEVLSTKHKHYPDVYILIIDYSATAASEQVKVGDEHTEYRWVTREEFLKLNALNVYKKLIERFVSQ